MTENTPRSKETLSDDALMALVAENLNQARHVENERMMFVTLFTALIGVLLSIVLSMGNSLVSTIVILLMGLLNYTAVTLVNRWNHVFKAHWNKAMAIAVYLTEKAADPDAVCEHTVTEENAEEFMARHPGHNTYFWFNNNTAHKNRYVSTNKLFLRFHYVIYILLAMALIYANLDNITLLLGGGAHV